MQLINLTPHVVRIEIHNHIVEIQPSGTIARVATSDERVGEIEGVPILRTVFGEITGLPEPQEDTYYIVSSLVAERARRPDVLAPDTLNAVRDERGQISYIRSFRQYV